MEQWIMSKNKRWTTSHLKFFSIWLAYLYFLIVKTELNISFSTLSQEKVGHWPMTQQVSQNIVQ